MTIALLDKPKTPVLKPLVLPDELRELFTGTREALVTDGWGQRLLFDVDSGRICLVGAMQVANGSRIYKIGPGWKWWAHPYFIMSAGEDFDLLRLSDGVDYLRHYLTRRDGWDTPVECWNDSRDDLSQVLDLLDEVLAQ